MRICPLPSRMARTSCSVLALATVFVVGATPASAQSFAGTGSFTTNGGAGASIGTSPNTTTITVNAGQTVIDWSPTDTATGGGAINFQPVGTTANFLGSGTFAVLNRINPADTTRSIALNGTIQTLTLGAAVATNGSLYFYTPGGFVIGGSAVINVGSLVLSASPILVDGAGNFINGASNTVIFGQALRPGAAIITSAGSQINATAGDAYVAMVAPRVQHGGTINVSGSAALVGAEAATISFSPDGLFDIQVTSGTTDANGVYNTGNIVGSASSGPGDIHRAYLVAVPKNSALTMLITTGSDLGFDVAGAANVVGNTVVLSAGRDIVDGAVAGVSAGSTAGALANIDLRDSNITSALVSESTGFTHIAGYSALRFYSDVNVQADGEIWFSTQTAVGTIDVDGNLSLSTARSGGAGQSVTASDIDVYNINGAGTINVDGTTTLNASAFGGGSGAAGTPGGSATGGVITVVASNGGSISLNNGLTATSNGVGGNSFAAGVDGGNGTGGQIAILTTGANSDLNISGPVTLNANGIGGGGSGAECFSCDGASGNGLGGTISISSISGSGGSTLDISGDVVAYADGTGGSTPNGTAGNGRGGTALYSVGTGNVMTLTGDLLLSAVGRGGAGGNGDGGDGRGGRAGITEQVDAASGTINIFGDVEISSDGLGGATNGEGASGGDGFGGDATGGDGRAYIIAFAATTTINGMVNVHSTGTGGDSSNGTGGNALGGLAFFNVMGSLDVTGNASVTANGNGGFGLAGGEGRGGNARITTSNGGTVDIDGLSRIGADGFGGNGASGFGGLARIQADGGTTIDLGSTIITADGVGGDGLEGNGNGGLGDGGVANVYAAGGTINFNGNAMLSASATGGSTNSGLGGGALGGSAQFRTDGGTISVSGNLALTGSATGGTGDSGGNATALISSEGNEAGPAAISIYVGNGGSVTVDGEANLDGRATGGLGINGNGGNAIAGEADVMGYIGDISLGGLSVDVSGRGGNGGGGGNGGSGRGGRVDATFGLNGDTVDGTITVGSATMTAAGFGGSGGAGTNGNVGGNGGAGGAGLGGRIGFTGTAAGAALESGPATLTVVGVGGQGGAGGNGDSGTGGSGGSGGNGTGGQIQTGTNSVSGSPGSGGGATYTTLAINSSATGGNGGSGGSGGGGNGAGGNGGNATGGSSVFLIRGVLGTADSVTLLANATGGNGGLGSIEGNGGNARTGIIAVESKDRFDVPTERGTLVAGSIVGSATAIGGGGAIDGTSTVVGGSSFRVLNGDATIGSVSITLSGDLIDPSLAPSFVSVRDGTAAIGSFSFVTDGTLSLDANNGAMNAGSITLQAGDFVPHVANDAPTVGGTYFANSFDIQTGNNFLTTAHLDSVATLTILAPGAIQIGNVTGDNNIVLQAAGGEIDIGTVLAGGGVDLDAADFITGGNVTANGVIDIDAGSAIGLGAIANNGNTSLNAGSSIDVGAINSGAGSVTLVTDSAYISGGIVAAGSIYADSGTNIILGNLTAPDDIELLAAGYILVGNANSGESIDLDAGGYVDGGTMTAGDSVYVTAGGSVDLLNISAGIVNQSSGEDAEYNVGILAGTTIDTGDIAAANSIGLGAQGDIYAGSIDAGDIFLSLGGGNMSFGTINAGGAVYLADDSMIALGGDPTGDDFDPAPILAATPVVSGGSITLRGAVAAGRFVAAASGTISGTTIASDSSIYVVNGGNMTLTDLDAGTFIFQRSSGVITENDLDAGGYIDVRSTGGLALGDLVAGNYIDLRSSNAISFATATSAETINFQGLGTLTGGAVTAGNSVLAETVGAIGLGAITAGITDTSTAPGAQFAVRLSSNGSITTGNVGALGRIGFGTPASLLAGTLTSGDGVSALVGGNIITGAIAAQNYTYFANYSMASLGGSFANFNLAPILSSEPFATGGSILVNGTIVTGTLHAAAGTNFTSGNITSNQSGDTDAAVEIDAGGLINIGNVVANGGIDFDAIGSVTAGNITSGQEIFIDAEGAIILGNLSAGLVNPQPQDVDEDVAIGILSATSIQVGTVDSADSVGFVTLGTLEIGAINTGGDLIGLAGGNMELGAIEASGRVYLANASIFVALEDENGDVSVEDLLNTVPVATGGSIQLLGAVNAGSFQAAAGTTLTGSTINSDGRLTATSGGNMTLGNLVADDDARLTSGGNIVTGSIDSFDDVALTATGSISTLDIFAYDDVSVDAGTTITTEDITGNSIALFADGDITTANLLTQNLFSGEEAAVLIPGTSITLQSGGDIDTGNIDALDGIYVSADGAIASGTIDAESSVELFADENIVTGDISTDGYVGLYVKGDLTVGSIDAGDDVIALVGDDSTFGAITTPERFFLGGYQMFALVNGGESFNPSAVFSAGSNSSTGGSATFTGSSSAESFEAYVGDDTMLASLSTTDFAEIDTGGLFTLTGAMNGEIRVISNDIDIRAGAAMGNGEVVLVSRNASQTLIGDGLDGLGQGYRLSDAEVDRIQSSFTISADTAYGAAPKMIIGDLSVVADGNSESELEYEFETINGDADNPSVGSIRVVGDVAFSGLGQFDEVQFDTNLFQLDAATGSVSLLGQGTNLSGVLGLYAPRVWVASGDILSRLELNPTYSGYIAELNAPAAVQRPEGVLRAGSIDIDTGEESLQSLLVQNTGTTELPAGFLTTTADIDGEEDFEPAPGSVNLVINGQLITESGTITGLAVRDFLVAEFGSAAFLPTSTINGCVLVGACSAAQPPIVNTPTRTDVPLSGGGGLGDGLFGNEGDIDDGESGDEGDLSSPIAAPTPLFDSRPLGQSGDIDDPVSGAGNPSLYGTTEDDENADDCDDKEAGCKVGKKGDGK